MNYPSNHLSRITLAAFCSVMMLFIVTSCSDNSTGGGEEESNMETGYIVSGQTPSGTFLVKYYQELPSGTVDLSDGTDFQNFFPNDSQNGAYFMNRTDGSAGFSKVVVNSSGQVVEEGVLSTVDDGSFSIRIRDEDTGVYQDLNNPDEITVFDPSDLSITGTIDMSAGYAPSPQRYSTFYFRDDLVFAPIRPNEGGAYDSTIVHIADLSTGSYVGTATKNSGQPIFNLGFGDDSANENGDIYVSDIGNPTGQNPISSILKIPAGSNEFDASYDFMPALKVNPQNTLLAISNGFYYHQNNKAYALVSTAVPQALIDLLASVGGDPSNLSEDQINQALNILYTAENGRWAQLDLQAQTVNPLPDFPAVSPFISGSGVVMESEGSLYFPVTTSSENALYTYDPATDESSKVFDVQGGTLVGVYNLSNDG